MKNSTPTLSEAARHIVLPSGIVTTAWPSVEKRSKDLGIIFDRWQAGCGKAILGKREDGVYAAGIGGVVISIPRQAGKTFLISGIVVSLCLLNSGITIIWTAHRMTTAAETFGSMQAMAKRQKIAPYVKRVLTGSDNKTVEFHNRSRILFGARERGFGRGIPDVDILVFDEAQILTEATMDDMVPATNVAENPLIILTGTPPKPKDPSEVFSRARREALAGESEDALYIEISADPATDPSAWPPGRVDWGQVAKANPSHPLRTPRASILRMMKLLGKESFRREGLGIWDEGRGINAVFSIPRWNELVNVAPKGRRAYGVKFATNGDRVALAVAVQPVEGPVFVEVVDVRSMGEGTSWLVSWLAQRAAGASRIVVDGRSDAGRFVEALRGHSDPRVPMRKVTVPSTEQAVAAHSGFLEAFRSGGLTHGGQPGLTAAVGAAAKRPIGSAGGFGWQAMGDGDVLGLEAATLAFWAAGFKPQRRGSGKVDVLR